MKIVIVGSSIAGAAAALAFSSHSKVRVYDQRGRDDISEKLCANICTSSLEKPLRELGIKENFIKTRYSKINVFSKENFAVFPTKEYEIDRKKLLKRIIQKAEKKRAVFNFSTKFINFEREGEKINVFFERDGKVLIDQADILIGADGALSEVAKKDGLFDKRRFFLFLQAKVKQSEVSKEFLPEKNRYSIFVGKDYGYYAYIFPSGNELTVGMGDYSDENVFDKFKEFLKKLKVKKVEIAGALIPEPNVIMQNKKVFLIGDANCNLKFSGGGIVPALEEAIALREKVLYGKDLRYQEIRRKIKMNRSASRFIKKLNDKDFDMLLHALKDKRFEKMFSFRDDIHKNSLLKMISPSLAWLWLRKSIF